jgi:hypothetical protein
MNYIHSNPSQLQKEIAYSKKKPQQVPPSSQIFKFTVASYQPQILTPVAKPAPISSFKNFNGIDPIVAR